MPTSHIILQKENFNRYSIKPITSALPRGYVQNVAHALNISRERVENVVSGKTFDINIIEELIKEYDKVRNTISNTKFSVK